MPKGTCSCCGGAVVNGECIATQCAPDECDVCGECSLCCECDIEEDEDDEG